MSHYGLTQDRKLHDFMRPDGGGHGTYRFAIIDFVDFANSFRSFDDSDCLDRDLVAESFALSICQGHISMIVTRSRQYLRRDLQTMQGMKM